MLRYFTAGESHGPGLTAVAEGLPAGLEVDAAAIGVELERRRRGHGSGRRMAIEQDEIEILGGVRFGRSLGSPIAILVRNTEWPKWQEEMATGPGKARRPMTTPRPGHADLAGMLKYDTHDARDILERASARETAARTVVGYLAKQLLHTAAVDVVGWVAAIGDVVADAAIPAVDDRERIEASPVRTPNPEDERLMMAAIDAARGARDTLGGIIEVVAHGLPAGIGSHVHPDRRLDARLAAALMSIQAMKGVEVGDGFAGAARPGSAAHDEIVYADGEFTRTSNRSGGIEGGMSAGGPLRVRVAMKPLSTLMRPLQTVDVESKADDVAFRERSDVCAVPRGVVVCEAMMSIVLAQEMQRQFGGDTVADFQAAVERYRGRLRAF